MIVREEGYSTRVDVKTSSKIQVISSVNHADILCMEKFEVCEKVVEVIVHYIRKL
jgi:hypothetical protein